MAMKVMSFLIALAMVTMLLEGCAYTDADGLTVGQRLDRAFTDANHALIEAGDTFSAKGDNPDVVTVDAFTSSLSDRALLTALAVSDAGISAWVKSELVKDADLAATKIDVDARDGVVTLNGSIGSEAARERAERIARGNRDVVRVDNQLTLTQL